MNNPLIFTDPSGYRPDLIFEEEERYRITNPGVDFNYFAGYSASGRYDPYHRYRSFHDKFSDAGNVGRFSRNPGPTGVLFDEEDNKYYSYQDPVSGKANAYFTDDEGRRVGQDGNRYYVWESEPFYGDRWVTAKRDGHTIFVRDFGVSAYKKYLFGFAVENWWYNSTISHLIPVSINFSVSFGYPAIGSADIGISVVIRGHNQGIYTTRSSCDQWILAHGGVGFNAGASWYNGDLRYFNFEKLYEANAVGWEADLGFWGVASQVTYADEFGGQLWTGELGLLGFGFGFTKDIPTGNADPWLIYGN